jgi:uncharacterized protein VirK/YbjX
MAFPVLFGCKDFNRSKFLPRLGRIFDLMMHPMRHWKVTAALATPTAYEALKKQPHLGIKYLHSKYLVKGLSTAERASAVIHHYSVLERKFCRQFLDAVMGEGVSIWDYETNGELHCISLVFSHPTDNEGELTLEYRFAGNLIYVASFNFAPGGLADLRDTTVVLITRMQGVAANFAHVQNAMKALKGLSAADVLTVAFEGLSNGLNIETILATGADTQVCYDDLLRPRFIAAYDKHFTAFGGEKITPKFYALALPLYEKDISKVKSSNRARVKSQRAVKRSIVESVGHTAYENRFQQRLSVFG